MDFMLLSFRKELNITTPHHLATWLDPYSHLVHPVHHPTAKDWKTTGPDLPEGRPINIYYHRHHFHYCPQYEILRTEVALATSPPHHFSVPPCTNYTSILYLWSEFAITIKLLTSAKNDLAWHTIQLSYFSSYLAFLLVPQFRILPSRISQTVIEMMFPPASHYIWLDINVRIHSWAILVELYETLSHLLPLSHFFQWLVHCNSISWHRLFSFSLQDNWTGIDLWWWQKHAAWELWTLGILKTVIWGKHILLLLLMTTIVLKEAVVGWSWFKAGAQGILVVLHVPADNLREGLIQNGRQTHSSWRHVHCALPRNSLWGENLQDIPLAHLTGLPESESLESQVQAPIRDNGRRTSTEWLHQRKCRGEIPREIITNE